MVRRLVVLVLASCFVLTSFGSPAQAKTASKKSPNVSLYFAEIYNSKTDHYKAQHQYMAYTVNGNENCHHCGRIVSTQVHGKTYYSVKLVKGERLMDAHWAYGAKDGVYDDGIWNGKGRLPKHEIDTIHGKREHMTISTINVDVYDPDYPEPSTCDQVSCGK